MTVAIYIMLFVVTLTYAAILAHYRHILEPDLTWLEVVLGVVICLLAPYADARLSGGDVWQTYESRTWLAFLVGGAPIIGWQLIQSVRSRLRVEQRIRGENDNTTSRTEALAAKRRSRPQEDD